MFNNLNFPAGTYTYTIVSTAPKIIYIHADTNASFTKETLGIYDHNYNSSGRYITSKTYTGNLSSYHSISVIDENHSQHGYTLTISYQMTAVPTWTNI